MQNQNLNHNDMSVKHTAKAAWLGIFMPGYCVAVKRAPGVGCEEISS